MATKPTKPVNLPKGEVAAPEDLLATASKGAKAYVATLTPTDSVLKTRGAGNNLEIYRELLRDDQVRSAYQQRRTAMLQAEMIVDPGAEDSTSTAAAEALKANLETIRWDEICDKVHYAIFYGWGVAEVMWEPAPEGNLVNIADIRVRDRARFRWTRDGALWLQTIRGLEQMPDRKFWTLSAGADNDDEPYGLGLAHSLYWPVWFKRNDIKFWLTFLERFGQPTSLIKIPAGQVNDPDTVQNAIALLQNITTDAGLVVPDNVVIELLEAARTGSADYGAMHDAMDKAISKIILSQTMTTDDGSSLAQAQVHAGVAGHVVKSDGDPICESFNRTVGRWWTEYNFPGAVPPRVWRNTEPPEDLNARAERDGKVYALGYEPTEDYIKETYGDGWVKKKEQPAPALFGAPGTAKGAPPEFAEGERAALAALKAANRADQQAIADAALQFANSYETVMGARVGALLGAAQDSDDYESFREKLTELLAEVPDDGTTEPLARGSFFSRLLGALRNQRPNA